MISAITLPHYLEGRDNALKKKLVFNAFTIFEVGQSEALKRGADVNVYYVPPTENNDGCIGLSEKSITNFLCTSNDELLPKLTLKEEHKIYISERLMIEKEKIIHFKAMTGLPSQNKTLTFITEPETKILLRSYAGIQGCSSLKISGWAKCS